MSEAYPAPFLHLLASSLPISDPRRTEPLPMLAMVQEDGTLGPGPLPLDPTLMLEELLLLPWLKRVRWPQKHISWALWRVVRRDEHSLCARTCPEGSQNQDPGPGIPEGRDILTHVCRGFWTLKASLICEVLTFLLASSDFAVIYQPSFIRTFLCEIQAKVLEDPAET